VADLRALRSLVRVSDPQISADGSRVAFVRTAHDYRKDANVSEIMLVPAAGGTPRALTDGKHEVAAPRWSPAGDRLAYLRKSARHGAQIFAIAAAGGAARAITQAKNDVEQFAWSPDGSQFVYVTRDVPADARAQARHDDLFDVHDDDFLTAAKPLSSHLWLVPSAGGKARRLTGGTWSVLENDASFVGGPSNPSWSSDGRTIAFARQANADDGDTDETTVALADVRTGAVRALSGRAHYEYEPVFSPRGKRVAYLYPRGPGPISVEQVRASEPGGSGAGRGVALTAQLDRDVTSALWMRDGGLLVIANDGIGSGMWFVPAQGGAVRRLDLGALVPQQFSVAASGVIAFTASDATHPTELYVLRSRSSLPRRLTDFNAAAARLEGGRSQEIRWTAPDGERSDGVVTFPARYVPGRSYPLVLRIHGGPEEASTLGYDVREGPPFRVLAAARGYVVFEPNYRGSDNLGTAHEHAIFRDPAAGPYADIMAGVAAVERLGVVDPSRICVTGHSYGGYLTAWIVGHDARWKCAIVSDGALDWLQTYDLSGAGNLAWTRDSLGGSPADPAAAPLYRDASAIAYAAAMKTPTLIFSGTADAVIPASESYELYHALKDRHVPVRFVAIPATHHFPTDPVRIESYWRITLDWLDRYLR
jgi:dipeptidyl aminopeptidase/acylaminoacyl peptidase